MNVKKVGNHLSDISSEFYGLNFFYGTADHFFPRLFAVSDIQRLFKCEDAKSTGLMLAKMRMKVKKVILRLRPAFTVRQITWSFFFPVFFFLLEVIFNGYSSASQRSMVLLFSKLLFLLLTSCCGSPFKKQRS